MVLFMCIKKLVLSFPDIENDLCVPFPKFNFRLHQNLLPFIFKTDFTKKLKCKKRKCIGCLRASWVEKNSSPKIFFCELFNVNH